MLDCLASNFNGTIKYDYHQRVQDHFSFLSLGQHRLGVNTPHYFSKYRAIAFRPRQLPSSTGTLSPARLELPSDWHATGARCLYHDDLFVLLLPRCLCHAGAFLCIELATKSRHHLPSANDAASDSARLRAICRAHAAPAYTHQARFEVAAGTGQPRLHCRDDVLTTFMQHFTL